MTPTEIVMPRLSDSMEEGTILQWLKQPGDGVAVGEELVEIETDKATMVYESDLAGTLLEVLVPVGETCAIGTVIARIGPSLEIPSVAGGGDRDPGTALKVSPVARRLAGEAGLDLSLVRGTGPRGRIVKADIEAAVAAGAALVRDPSPHPRQGAGATVADSTGKGDIETLELSRAQRVVAKRMTNSKATTPHFYLHADIDMTAAVERRLELKQLTADGQRVPSYNDMVVKACGLALRDFPLANGSYAGHRFELHPRINIGIAVASPGALLVPTIFDADRKALSEIAEESASLAAKVRAGSITPPELAGATFSVSNLGMYGVASFQAIIDTPQAAMLAVGEIVERPVVDDGQLTSAHLMSVTLSCDHRILYGADGAQLLARVRFLLEKPVALALRADT